MDFKDTPLKSLPIRVLIDRLSEGWGSTHAGTAEEFIQRWATAFKAPVVNIKQSNDNAVSFTTLLGDICIRAMDNVPCLLVSGKEDLNTAMMEFWHRYNNIDYLPFVIALSAGAYEQAKATLANGNCVILSVEQVKELFRSDERHELLKQFIRSQIHRRALIPYNFFLPAGGGMFFGRQGEMSRLSDDPFTSFAIAGPGRIGKTSLLNQYGRQALRQHKHQSKTRFSINLYSATPDGTARFLAMRIDPGKRSDRIVAKTLIDFFIYQKKKLGGPLELLLDEVDEVCQSEAFRYLGEAARLGLCRLILCGRGVLLKTILSSSSPLEGLELLQLAPLDDSSARGLLLKPLIDMGFTISDPEELTSDVLAFSGRLPHLVQLIGRKLVDRAIRGDTETISQCSFQDLKMDFYLAQYFTAQLNDVRSVEAHLIALLLLKCEQRLFTIQFVSEMVQQEGLHLNYQELIEICNELVILNVLSWESGLYRISSGGLYFYALTSGYLDGALEEALDKTRESRRG